MKEGAVKNPRGTIKNIRCVRVKDNVTKIARGYKEASEVTGIGISTIKNNLNWDDRIAKGFKFYDY